MRENSSNGVSGNTLLASIVIEDAQWSLGLSWREQVEFATSHSNFLNIVSIRTVRT